MENSPTSLRPFWEALETNFPLAGVRKSLNDLLSESLVEALEQSALFRFERQSPVYPCPKPGGAGCPRHIRVRRDGRIVAICGNHPPECDDVMLSDREAELIGVNPEELVAALREPLLFGGTDNIETELRHVYLGGAYLPFWTAVVVFTFTRGVGDLAGWIFTSAACSSAAVLMGALQGRGVPPRGAERAVGAAGCKDCGK